MFLHLEFTDGSNPWYFFGNEKECQKQLENWIKKYSIDTKDSMDNGVKIGIMGTVHIPKKRSALSF